MSLYHLLRTVFFLIPTIGFYTILAGTLSVVSTFWDPSGRTGHAGARLWGRLILATTGVRVTVRGLEQLVPGTTYVFVSNHQSFYDIPVVFRWIPYELRIIAKESLGRVPFVGWHLRRSGNLLVDRANPDRNYILDRWRSLVAEGRSLIIFAEGTRSVDGRVARFKAGGFMLALQTGVPVVPISIAGSRQVMQKGRLTTRPGHIVLTVHAPISTTSGEWSPTLDDARKLAARARSLIAASLEADEIALGCRPRNQVS